MKTDSATAACAKLLSLAQVAAVSLGREGCSPSALNPELRVGAFASLFPVLSHCFMRLDKFLSLWAN